MADKGKHAAMAQNRPIQLHQEEHAATGIQKHFQQQKHAANESQKHSNATKESRKNVK